MAIDWVAVYEARIRWHQVAVDALKRGVPFGLIQKHTLPINVATVRLIDGYTSCLQKEIYAFENDLPTPYPIYSTRSGKIIPNLRY